MNRFVPILVLSLAACAGSHVALSGEPKYGKTAEENFQWGEEEMKDKNYPEAIKFLEHVRNKFPYSKFAPLAELRLADARFENERFVEAADAYKSFVKLHPTHESVDYAAFRIGLSHYRDAPGDFILFPASYEKDQAQLRTAIAHLDDFIKSYPESKYLPDAKRVQVEANDRLAEHEWYVADFYRKRKRWPGAAGRLEILVKDFPGSKFEGEALYQLADAYLHMNEKFRAQQTLQQLIVKHPDDPRRADAEKQLAQLR
jgi:outer membrane protein assembly factor BamD